MNVSQRKSLSLAIMAATFLPLATGQAQQNNSTPRVVIASTRYVPSVLERRAPEPAKRFWTNDDFPAHQDEAATGAAEETPAATVKPDTADPVPAASSTETQQVQQEVVEEMLVTARNRQKSYEDTIGLVEARLQSETSEFRKEVYQRILEDTRALKQVNEQMLKRFEGMSGGGEHPPESPNP